METQDMYTTQVSVWEIQHPSTFYQYQDTVEMLMTVLDQVVDIGSVQGIKTMIHIVTIVHSASKVPGGIITAAIIRTSMVSTMVDHTLPGLMV